MSTSPNQPAAGQRRSCPCGGFVHHRPGVPEPERWAALDMKLLFSIVLSVALTGCSKKPSFIRVQNEMGRDLATVTVGSNSFGLLKSGATSDYQLVPTMFESSSVYTKESDGRFHNDRFMGGRNDELASGRYTYILKLGTNDMLEVTLKRE